MAVMPEASSALFMSQFSDEAVRDAIARVSHSISLSLSLISHIFILFTLKRRQPCVQGFAVFTWFKGRIFTKAQCMFIQTMLCVLRI